MEDNSSAVAGCFGRNCCRGGGYSDFLGGFEGLIHFGI